MFTNELIQAISDWQQGGDARTKQKRGLALKHAVNCLPAKYKQTPPLACFRRLVLAKEFVWKLAETLHLTETISSWTIDADVAMTLKDGVPAPERKRQGVIFERVPTSSEVIVNLHLLYQEPEFLEACVRARSEIEGYDKGIGEHGNSQREVILHVEVLPLSAVFALSGHSSSIESFTDFDQGKDATADARQAFHSYMVLSGAIKKTGPQWITLDAKDRALGKALEAVEVLKPYHPRWRKPKR